MGNSFTGGVARRSGGVVKILIVDDSKAMRMIVSRVLRQAGYGNAEFVEASNGAEGLAAARAGGVDLILSDWNMPEMNGIEFLQALRAGGSTARFGFVTSESTWWRPSSGFQPTCGPAKVAPGW